MFVQWTLHKRQHLANKASFLLVVPAQNFLGLSWRHVQRENLLRIKNAFKATSKSCLRPFSDVESFPAAFTGRALHTKRAKYFLMDIAQNENLFFLPMKRATVIFCETVCRLHEIRVFDKYLWDFKAVQISRIRFCRFYHVRLYITCAYV